MDVPVARARARSKELNVKVGDKVSEGTLILVLEVARGRRNRACRRSATRHRGRPLPAPAKRRASARRAPPPAPIPGAATYTGKADVECEMLVLGSGPGGYSAAFRAADLGMKTVLVERYATLGGVCLNVGCIPSKALLHIAARDGRDARRSPSTASRSATPQVDLDKLRAWKNKVVGKLTGGLAGMAKARKVEVVRGIGQFLDAASHRSRVTEGPGQARPAQKGRARSRRRSSRPARRSCALPFVAGRSAHRRFDRRARAARRAEAAAGHRRRHHRPRDGHRLLDAGRAARRRRDARRPDARAPTATWSASGRR